MALGLKTGGRKSGTPNKSTLIGKELIMDIIEKLEKTAYADIESIGPKDRMMLLKDLLEFISPKLNRTEVKQDGVHETVIRVIEDDSSKKSAD